MGGGCQRILDQMTSDLESEVGEADLTKRRIVRSFRRDLRLTEELQR
jgi:hypothetical protein